MPSQTDPLTSTAEGKKLRKRGAVEGRSRKSRVLKNGERGEGNIGQGFNAHHRRKRRGNFSYSLEKVGAEKASAALAAVHSSLLALVCQMARKRLESALFPSKNSTEEQRNLQR